jgi:hypothetical protein
VAICAQNANLADIKVPVHIHKPCRTHAQAEVEVRHSRAAVGRKESRKDHVLVGQEQRVRGLLGRAEERARLGLGGRRPLTPV